jgi:hypothetical protein
VINQSGGQFVQGPWVDTNPSNGPFLTVSSSTDPPVGTTVCKSGITTKWTCGKVTVKHETVTYDTGAIFGLTRHSACQEPGDAGGPVVAVTGTSYVAAGTSSCAAGVGRLAEALPLHVRTAERVLVLPGRHQPRLLRPRVRGQPVVTRG